MTSARILDALSLLAEPTAPFHESAVRESIRSRLSGLPGVRLTEDRHGNLLATYLRGARAPRWVLCAHMDHPGWVRDPRTRRPTFLGSVPKDRLKEGAVRWFGRFGMWDLPALERDGDRIRSRACDDLAGCAAIVAAFEELSATRARGAVMAAFTIAEEVGFVGATLLARSGLIPADAVVVSLEASSVLPGVEQGAGPILRVGDRASVFDDLASARLGEIAGTAGVTFQRRLMTGGTCEGTTYQAHGYRTAALAVPLGNYHNLVPGGGIGPESIHLGDFSALARWGVAIASARPELDRLRARLRRRLNGPVTDHRAWLRVRE